MTKRHNIRYILTSLMLTFAIVRYCKDYQCNQSIYYDEKLADDPNYYLSCDAGDIYIGPEKTFASHTASNRDILVFDDRDSDDPNLHIVYSYKITDKQQITEILLILKDFEKNNPSKWRRSLISMENEWQLHNILYERNYLTVSTRDLDLNNEDEFLITKKNIETVLSLTKNSNK